MTNIRYGDDERVQYDDDNDKYDDGDVIKTVFRNDARMDETLHYSVYAQSEGFIYQQGGRTVVRELSNYFDRYCDYHDNHPDGGVDDQSCEMSNLLHRAKLPDQILPQEKACKSRQI